jgi:phospholipase/carboxylesterase
MARLIVVPVSALHAAEHALRRVGVNVATHISPGLGYSVDPVGLRMGADFIASELNRGANAV